MISNAKDPGMLKIIKLIVLSAIYFLASGHQIETKGQGSKVIIKKAGKEWKLEVNGNSFYVKGVVGDQYLSKVKEYGGNSIRIGWQKKELDEAWSLGLNALVNLPADAERYGFDYNDTAADKETDRKNSLNC